MSRETPYQKEYQKSLTELRSLREAEYVQRLERFSWECIAALATVAKTTNHEEAVFLYESMKEDWEEIKRVKKLYGL